MRISLLVTVPFVWSLCGAFAQSPKKDSLISALNNAEGLQRVQLLYELCALVRPDDRDQAYVYGRQALFLSEKINSRNFRTKLYYELGRIKRSNSETDSAIYFFTKSLENARLDNDQQAEIEAYNNIGIGHEQKGELANSMEWHLKALTLSEQVGDSLRIANTYNSIGFVYKAQNDNNLALENFNKALTIRKKLKLNDGIAGSLNNIGMIYLNTKEYTLARKYFLEAAGLIDTATHKREFSMLYNNLGITYENQQAHNKAHEYYVKSLAIKQKIRDKRGIASTYGNIGANLEKAGKYQQAIPYSELSYQLSKEIKALDMMITATRNLSRCYKGLGRYSQTVVALEKLDSLEEALYSVEKAAQIEEMRAKYEAEKRERENAQLRDENIVKEIQSRNTLYALLIAILLVAIVMGLAIILWRRNLRKTKVNEMLNQYNKKVQETNSQLEESLTEKNNLMNVVAHDLRSPLNKVKGLLELIRLDGALNENQQSYIQKMNAVIDQGTRLISDLLVLNKHEVPDIREEEIFIHQLASAVESDYRPIAKEKNIVLHMQVDTHYPSVVLAKDNFIRIVDNLLTNAIKFSPPGKRVHVRFQCIDQFLCFTVKDEGPGFTEEDKKHLFKKYQRLSAQPTAGEPSIGLGLTIVKQLCDSLQGDITLHSTANQGAEFKIALPVKVVATKKR